MHGEARPRRPRKGRWVDACREGERRTNGLRDREAETERHSYAVRKRSRQTTTDRH